jgi:cellulose synthase/poly-beta-1,6-N-acetylglucosamine synthase-like glycosyltransferase
LVQILVLLVFCFFAFFNYLYGVASLFKPRIRVAPTSGERVAVVIVAYNERNVLPMTVAACENLSYPNKLVLLADDSSDATVVESLRELARSRGCVRVDGHRIRGSPRASPHQSNDTPVEIWESTDFVLFHRDRNEGFKGGSLEQVRQLLKIRDIKYMYLLDADWHPQKDALERTLEVLQADDGVAFVQTKRLAFEKEISAFQRYVAIYEEGCYYVDSVGRQVLGHPILFSGCCTLFRLDAIERVGGFTPGHLTEDLDLTDRLWLAGWKGVYRGDVVNHGEVPFAYEHFRRQQERWAAGSARALKEFFWPLVWSRRLNWIEKLSAIRQNAYFASPLVTGLAILLGAFTVSWLSVFWNSYEVECYLLLLGYVKTPLVIAIYACVVSNFVEPLVMILAKKRRLRELPHLLMMVWYA